MFTTTNKKVNYWTGVVTKLSDILEDASNMQEKIEQYGLEVLTKYVENKNFKVCLSVPEETCYSIEEILDSFRELGEAEITDIKLVVDRGTKIRGF